MAEKTSNTDKHILEQGEDFLPRFDENGLLPAIVQDYKSGDVLMFAFMNEEALKRTIEVRQAHFWSRSRQELWHKGATSGDFLEVHDVLVDCDQDVIIVKVHAVNDAACHTGERSCFYRLIVSKGDSVKLARINQSDT